VQRSQWLLCTGFLTSVKSELWLLCHPILASRSESIQEATLNSHFTLRNCFYQSQFFQLSLPARL
jgi:hypothetical protein